MVEARGYKRRVAGPYRSSTAVRRAARSETGSLVGVLGSNQRPKDYETDSALESTLLINHLRCLPSCFPSTPRHNPVTLNRNLARPRHSRRNGAVCCGSLGGARSGDSTGRLKHLSDASALKIIAIRPPHGPLAPTNDRFAAGGSCRLTGTLDPIQSLTEMPRLSAIGRRADEIPFAMSCRAARALSPLHL